MPWDKNEKEAFPSRHPREPIGLRQDILDEIADHLACAAERERENNVGIEEETVWHRVLHRFGNPDTTARRLWWEQMRETVMREWIQSGVMVIAAVAVVVGVVFMGIMLGRVNTANDTMAAAMEQVSASNEALVAALSGLRNGGEANTLELSTIEIVIRRGTPDGPPAPEVKVEMHGKGPNGDSMTVDGDLDEEGRGVFARLHQGTYTFSFEDPQSQLFLTEKIALFAGKGAGEHIVVAPDVLPRPIHVDWDLPAYGRDDEVLIATTLEGRWEHGDRTWTSRVGVVSGHENTRAYRTAAGGLKAWHDAEHIEVGDESNLASCVLAGDVYATQKLALRLLSEPKLPGLRSGHLVWKLAEKSSSNQPFVRRTARNQNGTLDSPVLTEVSEGRFEAALPPAVLEQHKTLARQFRNREGAKEEEFGEWVVKATRKWTNAIVSKMITVPGTRWGEERNGALYAPGAWGEEVQLGRDIPSRKAQRVVAISLPDSEPLPPDEGHSSFLAVSVSRVKKNAVERVDQTVRSTPRVARPTTKVIDIADVSGNVLVAYAIRSDWRDETWPAWDEATGRIGASIKMDDTPFWRIPSETLQSEITDGNIYIPVPPEWFAAGTTLPTGVLLRWEKRSEEFAWPLKLYTGDRIKYQPCWIVTEPIEGESSGRPLDDIDGRFHYDSLKTTEPAFSPVDR